MEVLASTNSATIYSKDGIVHKRYISNDIQIRELLILKYLNLIPHKYIVNGKVTEFVKNIVIEMPLYAGSLNVFDRIAEENVKRLINQIGNAISFMHVNNILHRDIKAENILITSLNENETDFILCDFGCSKHILSVLKDLPTEDTTKLYQAPELFSSESRGIFTEKTDAWAFGCVIFRAQHGFLVINDLYDTSGDFYYAVLQNICKSLKLHPSDKDFIASIQPQFKEKNKRIRIFNQTQKFASNSFLRINPAERALIKDKFNCDEIIQQVQVETKWPYEYMCNESDEILMENYLFELAMSRNIEFISEIKEFIRKQFYYLLSKIKHNDLGKKKILICSIYIAIMFYVPHMIMDDVDIEPDIDYTDVLMECILNAAPYFS